MRSSLLNQRGLGEGTGWEAGSVGEAAVDAAGLGPAGAVAIEAAGDAPGEAAVGTAEAPGEEDTPCDGWTDARGLALAVAVAAPLWVFINSWRRALLPALRLA
jgi:hypothetical protein